MSTTSIIVAIVCLLGVLVSYAFVQQTVQRKREQKARLVAALKSRARSFKYILNGFPQGFLTKELTALVQKSLAEVCEQLGKLDPGDPQHRQDLQMLNAHIAESQRSPAPDKPATLDNPSQIKEVRACLEELHKFVFRLEEKQSVARPQARLYRSQIKLMVLQLSVDAYWIHGAQARQAGKLKLAIHYFELALNLIMREGQAEAFRNKLVQLKEAVAALKEQLNEDAANHPLSPQEAAENEGVADEWNKFAKVQGEWKKKTIYD